MPVGLSKYIRFLPLMLLATISRGQADTDAIKNYIRNEADILTADSMHGRGYVLNGRAIAAAYLQHEFKKIGLKPSPGSRSYAQRYNFPVNTFPGAMKLVVNGKELAAGADYIIDAGSPSIRADAMPAQYADMAAIEDLDELKKVTSTYEPGKARILLHTDSMCSKLKLHPEQIAGLLPRGCYIIPIKNKLTWTVSGTQIAATVFYARSTSLPDSINEVAADVKAVLDPNSENENLVAVVPGDVKGTFIAFTGHYDHLGMMGGNAVFPGASDNASGVSMLLYLASYFAAHPGYYPVLFILFSGEEAGLLGSAYYVRHPLVPLANIKFLTNIDIMGDASGGVTVVNATEYKEQFALLQQINSGNHYIPVIKSRGKAHNSDHWHFTEAGVPSFFMYSNGGKGYYHDIYDKSSELKLNHIGGVAQLLIDFAVHLR